jgi:hypothetical protein
VPDDAAPYQRAYDRLAHRAGLIGDPRLIGPRAIIEGIASVASAEPSLPISEVNPKACSDSDPYYPQPVWTPPGALSELLWDLSARRGEGLTFGRVSAERRQLGF